MHVNIDDSCVTIALAHMMCAGAFLRGDYVAIRFTTPTEHLVIRGIDLSQCHVMVSMSQGTRQLDLVAEDVTYDGSDTHIYVHLSQEQSSTFFNGNVNVQVNWISPDGKRDATLEGSLPWHGNLLDKVVEDV